jgi:RNA polymerase sigma factor (sigma-70 family)
LNQRKSKASQVQRLFGQPLEIVSGLPSAQDRIEGDEFGAALQHAISRLPARQREVLTLSRFDGMSRAEIAEVTGLSPQTVANYLAAALSSLRATLGPYLSDR